MTRADFRELISREIVILDGATGTELVKRGMPGGVCPEAWILENPHAIESVGQEYAKAGSHIVYAPTFGGNRPKLTEFGLEDDLYNINYKLASIACKNLPNSLVFGDIAPTGLFVEPNGPLAFEDAVAIFKEQAQPIIDAGVDGFAIETMLDLQEARAALIAIRELCDLPIIVTMTFDESGRTLTGCHAVSSLVALQNLGADAFGCNCSTGPEFMLPIIAELKDYAKIPLVAKPNAGMPKLVDMKTVFDLAPDGFATQTAEIVAAGANIVGGCCGTTPLHIAALAKAVKNVVPEPIVCKYPQTVSSAREFKVINAHAPFSLIGERINPTGKKALQAELRAGSFELVRQYAMEQSAQGASLLDLNCGMSGIDECEVLRRLVAEIGRVTATPLCIDTTRCDAAEAALRLYPGRALFNSISAESDRLEKVLPIAAKYGAMLVVLPLTDEGIPESLEGRIEALNTIFEACDRYGIPREDCCVDALVMTVSANPEAAKITLELIEYATRVLHCNTVCGLSNVSFGLPRRELANAAFLGMAMGRGLNMAIANPSAPLIADTIFAGDLLAGRDQKMATYISRYGGSSPATQSAKQVDNSSSAERVANAIMSGNIEQIEALIAKALQDNYSAQQLVDDYLIVAISKVGDLFEEKRYFLPQLVQSADTMRQAMSYLIPLLDSATEGGKVKPIVVLATVKGDIHDIGKNIVGLMLRNYGFEVIDLGKDVAAEVILDAAVKHGAKLVGLSALMTTTMVEMESVIKLARERKLDDINFIVGGAVLSADYAEQIGASYAKDALDTVKKARAILGVEA